jgi:hypothetical protein
MIKKHFLLLLVAPLMLACASAVSSESSFDPADGLDPRWANLLNVSQDAYTAETLTLSSSFTSKGITEAVVVSAHDSEAILGLAYEANVRGFVGQVRFRVAIVDQQFAAFFIISDNEHAAFGRVFLTAMRLELAGNPATYEAAIAVWVNSSRFMLNVSGTYNGIMPALEAMTLHYADYLSNL